MLRSPLPDIDLPVNTSLWDFLQDFDPKYLDNTFLVEHETGKQYTYREMFSYVNNIRSALYELGLKKGDAFVHSYDTSIEGPLVMFAVWSLGGINIGIYDTNVDQLEVIVQDFSTKFLLTREEHTDHYQKVTATSQIKVLVLDEKASKEDHVSIQWLKDFEGPRAPQIPINPQEDLASVVYSSGTTGRAKAILLTHYAYVGVTKIWLRAISDQADITGGETSLVIICIYRNWPTNVLLQSVARAQRVVMIPYSADLSVSNFLSLVEKYKVTKLLLLPAISANLVSGNEIDNHDVSSVRDVMNGCSTLHKSIAEKMWQKLPCVQRVRSGFGMSETAGAITCPLADNKKLGCIGSLLPNVEARIVNLDTGLDCGPNEFGELYIRSPFVMKRYLGIEMSEVFDEDMWLHTGDCAFYDDDEDLYLLCRLNELLPINGVKLPPAIIEEILLEAPHVVESAVVGVKSDGDDSISPVGFVVLEPDRAASREDIEKYVNNSGKLPSACKAGIRVYVVPKIPLSSMYKPLRKTLLQYMEQSS